jgi:DNA invertase Pin-like site-specific DNA recombinase
MSLLVDTRPPVRAAQYLRMSTEHQRYSPDNQKTAIDRYALERGYEIVQTYIDAGKSGLTLRGRDGLKQLLSDAVSGSANFNAILVLDVSRWGRFQDVDQGSHYEWLCREAGVSVHYVAEPFEQDGSIASSLIKQLKRVMAGEFSRELSSKVMQAHTNYANAGFIQGGILPYGVRRLVVDEHGVAKGILEAGNRKGFRSDRVVPIPGPKHEIAVINRIYKLYIAGKSHHRIAEILNGKGIPAARPAVDPRQDRRDFAQRPSPWALCLQSDHPPLTGTMDPQRRRQMDHRSGFPTVGRSRNRAPRARDAATGQGQHREQKEAASGPEHAVREAWPPLVPAH